MRRLGSWIPVLAGLVLPVAGDAQTPISSGAFISRLGSDTFWVERFSRTANRLEGDVITRVPRTTVRHYVFDLGSDGRPTRMEVTTRSGRTADSPVIGQTVATVRGDSIVVEVTGGNNPGTRMVAVPGLEVPMLGNAWGPYELLAGRLGNRDSATIVTWGVGGRQGGSGIVRRVSRDSLAMTVGPYTYRARVDAQSRIHGVDARTTTQKVLTQRLESVDIAAIAASFASRDSTPQGMPIASPRDTVRATVGAASLVVDYGRPSRRGRVIFGAMEPWDSVWRTGANAATQLETNRDLMMGSTMIPAGKYTLWTIPSRSGWKLIINKQTGQWGTIYDRAQDLARVDLKTETLPATVEQFTISIVPEGQGAVLRLDWDRTRAFIPFLAH